MAELATFSASSATVRSMPIIDFEEVLVAVLADIWPSFGLPPGKARHLAPLRLGRPPPAML